MPPPPTDFGPHFDFPPAPLNGGLLHDPYPQLADHKWLTVEAGVPALGLGRRILLERTFEALYRHLHAGVGGHHKGALCHRQPGNLSDNNQATLVSIHPALAVEIEATLRRFRPAMRGHPWRLTVETLCTQLAGMRTKVF